jgi:hypothetical protein
LVREGLEACGIWAANRTKMFHVKHLAIFYLTNPTQLVV